MKKHGRPERIGSLPQKRSTDYLYFKVAQVGAKPRCSVTGFDNPVKVLDILRVVNDGLMSVRVNCNKLYFHAANLLNMIDGNPSPVSSRLQPVVQVK